MPGSIPQHSQPQFAQTFTQSPNMAAASPAVAYSELYSAPSPGPQNAQVRYPPIEMMPVQQYGLSSPHEPVALFPQPPTAAVQDGYGVQRTAAFAPQSSYSVPSTPMQRAERPALPPRKQGTMP
jgi:hypothetical protein